MIDNFTYQQVTTNILSTLVSACTNVDKLNVSGYLISGWNNKWTWGNEEYYTNLTVSLSGNAAIQYTSAQLSSALNNYLGSVVNLSETCTTNGLIRLYDALVKFISNYVGFLTTKFESGTRYVCWFPNGVGGNTTPVTNVVDNKIHFDLLNVTLSDMMNLINSTSRVVAGVYSYA